MQGSALKKIKIYLDIKNGNVLHMEKSAICVFYYPNKVRFLVNAKIKMCSMGLLTKQMENLRTQLTFLGMRLQLKLKALRIPTLYFKNWQTGKMCLMKSQWKKELLLTSYSLLAFLCFLSQFIKFTGTALNTN